MTSTTVPHDLVSFFVWNIEKLIVWCISAKKKYNLTENKHKFEVSVTKRYTSLNKSPGIKILVKKLNH